MIPFGLYFHDAGDRVILMVGTTKGNCEGYTDREIEAATEDREGLSIEANPPMGGYINMVRSGLIHNCPITPKAVTISTTFFDPQIATLTGVNKRKYSEPVVTDYVKILQRILDLNKEVTLTAYVMFVNGIVLFVSTSQ